MKQVIFIILFALAGCASVSPPPAPSIPETVMLQVATEQPAGLNVGIVEFIFDTPEDRSLRQVRSLESRYFPYLLRQTLERSGYWGAVRVVPRGDADVELMITGRIVSSSGQALTLNVKAVDARGVTWLHRDYDDVAGDLDYATDPVYQVDPFQDLYNQVANDLGALIDSLDPAELDEMMQVSTMKFAERLSPETFGDYLYQADSVTTVSRLPAANDPMMARIHRLRDSEYLFTDSVDEHYQELYNRLGRTYAWWRYYNYELTMGNERLSDKDARRGATRGSWYAMERIYKTYKESRMNEDALLEMTRSFDRETAPIVAEVSGRVVELGGTLDEQVDLWREILSDMYQEELGINRQGPGS